MTNILFSLFLSAIAVRESRSSTDIGKHQEHGRYQVRQCVLDDVEKYYHVRFSLAEMEDDKKAAAVCRLYLTHWGDHYTRLTGNPVTVYVLARVWNGGPDGWKKHETVPYGQAVNWSYRKGWLALTKRAGDMWVSRNEL